MSCIIKTSIRFSDLEQLREKLREEFGSDSLRILQSLIEDNEKWLVIEIFLSQNCEESVKQFFRSLLEADFIQGFAFSDNV